MMSLRLKIIIAVLALGLSAFAVFGDAFFVSLGLASGSGRIVIAGLLLIIGVAWFIWTSASWRKNADIAAGRTGKKPGDKIG
jgi:hypothetical protein